MLPVDLRRRVRRRLSALSGRLELDIRYFSRGGFWLLLRLGASYLLGLGRSVAFARLVDQSVYGQFAFVVGVANTVSILTLPGVDTAVVEAVARGKRGSVTDGVRVRLRWGLLATLAMISVSLYHLIQGQGDAALALVVAAVLLPFLSAGQVVQAYYTGCKRFDKTSLISLTVLVLNNAALLVAVLSGTSVVWLVVANSLPQLLLQLWVYGHVVRRIRDAPTDPDVASYGKALTWADAVKSVAAQLDSVVLGFSGGFVDVAIYRIASVLPKSIQRLPKMLRTLLMPKIAGQPHKRVYSSRTHKHLIHLWLLNGCLALLAAVGVRYLIPVLYGETYGQAVTYAQLLTISIVPVGPNSFFIAALQARKETRAIYRANLLDSVLQIGTLVALVPSFGILGIIVSRIASRWGGALYRWYAVTKI